MSRRAAKSPVPLLSVVLAVADDEEVVGYRVRRLVEHLRLKQIAFEIVAVNAGSRDNSFAVLALLAQHEPALRIFPKAQSGKAFLKGASEARGELIALMEAAAPLSLTPLSWAMGRLSKGPGALVFRGRYVVARRVAALPILVNLTGPSPFFERWFERASQGIGVHVVGTRPQRTLAQVASESAASLAQGRLLAPLLRLIAA